MSNRNRLIEEYEPDVDAYLEMDDADCWSDETVPDISDSDIEAYL